MIKKNLVLTVTETQPSGEELLYTIKSVANRSTFVFAAGAPEVLINDIPELLESISIIEQFGRDNPTEEGKIITVVKTESDPLAIAPIEFGEVKED